MPMTTPRFFSVGHNSFSKRGFPWIQSLSKGFRQFYLCKQCASSRSIMYADGPVEAVCDPRKGVKWPDIIGCGHFPFFILSERTIRAFSADGIGEFPHHAVLIQPPLPKKLAVLPAPRYFWLDGQKMKGALLDFDASGFVGMRFCAACGTRTDDITTTFDRQDSGTYPYAFRHNTWNGTHLFTSDLSHTAFFCTERVLDCARRHKLTNFRFVPVEEGVNSGSTGMEYL